jgi:nucleotide-binding universal stress UspA family protein
LKEAIKLAKGQRARLRVLHVVDLSFLTASTAGDANLDDFVELWRRDGEQVLRNAVALAARSRIRAERAMIEATEQRTAQVIIDAARRWRADLIVMGTHGRRGFNRALLGSDAEGVARMASVPLLLIRGDSAHQASRKRKQA